MSNTPIKVAIIGGGCAGVTTAFELTRPELQGRYQVTLYQNGWRLGGKGASGRGKNDRIEEHGLHLWMGFYENAFKVLRECYEELARDPSVYAISRWQQVFDKDPFVGVADQCNDGQWRAWTAHFPVDDADPGDPLSTHNPFSVSHYFSRALALLKVLLRSLQMGTVNQSDRATAGEFNTDQFESPNQMLSTLLKLTRLGKLSASIGAFEALQMIEVLLEKVPYVPHKLLDSLFDIVRSAIKDTIQSQAHTDDEMRRLWVIADIILACLQGAIRFELFTDPRGFDAIDDHDWRDWLMLNGASRASVDSAFMRGIYDLLFAYENGDIKRPRMSAAQALRGAVRMFFSSRGAIFWKMKAGMGDVIFAPFYEVLKKRGVRVEFFHRLKEVQLVDPGKLRNGETEFIEALEFNVQAKVIDKDGYRPLKMVKGIPSWPAAPDYSQLENGEELEKNNVKFESDWEQHCHETKTLTVSKDFDFVVLAVGLGAVPQVCRQLIDRNPQWAAMVDHLATVETQAMQLWMTSDMSHLGWRQGPINLSGYVTPFDTWADMSHLIEVESWPEQLGSIAYFCSVLPDVDNSEIDRGRNYAVRRREEVRRNCVRFLNEDIAKLWPNAADPSGKFRWELLAGSDASSHNSEDEPVDEAKFDSQFWTANVNASDRYVLSLPGTTRYRISPLELHYDNLTIAGDWTECSHNAGCVESAVMSGRLAAHALSGSPALDEIIGYNHP